MPVVSDFTSLLYDDDAQRVNGMTSVGAPVFITYSFLQGTDLPARDEVSLPEGSNIPTSVHGFTSDQQAAFHDAVTQAEAVAGIRFIEVGDPDDATIQVFNVQGTPQSFANTPWVSTWSTSSGNLVIDPWSPTDDFSSGTTWYETILHELGHAIGLAHPFDGTNTLEASLDNDDNTLMSYTSNGVNDTEFATLDVQALQHLYGTGSNLDPAVSWSWDTAARLFTLTGSANDDTLISTDTDSALSGGAGADLLIGRDGDDQLSGGNDGDQLQLSSGTDTMNLGSGADEIIWGGSFDGETTVSDFDIAQDWLDLSILTPSAVISVLRNFINDFADYIGYSSSRVYLTGVEGADRGLVDLELPGIVNSGPEGTPTVYGSYWQGGTISSSASQWAIDDPDGVIESSRTYQWLRDGAEIPRATSANYVATQEDVNTLLSYRVSYLDFWGNLETVTSTATPLVSNVNDDPTGAPVILGTAAIGNQLSVDTSGIDDIDGLGAFSHEWIRDGLLIGTEATYTVDNSDLGSEITVRVSYVDGFGRTEFITSVPTAPVSDASNATATGDVLITGSAMQGETLTADASGLSDPDGLGAFSYAWLRDGTPIAGAGGDSYVLTQGDVGAQISVEVSYTDGGGSNESVTGGPTGTVASNNEDLQGDSGDNTVSGGEGDDTLSGGPGNDTLEGGPDADRFVINPGDERITILDFELGLDLLDLLDFTRADALSAFFNAQAGSAILTFDDGTVVTVDGDGVSPETLSQNDVAFAAGNLPPEGSVVVTGDATEGQTLVADASGVTDGDGIEDTSVEFQWLRDGAAIPDATESSYDLTLADVGATLSVVYSYTDDFGTDERGTSSATASVAAAGQAITGTPDPDGLVGGVGSDTIEALRGDDTITATSGNDRIDGGEGEDTVLYSGDQSSYTLTLSPAATTLTDRRAEGNGTDTLAGMEFLDFDTDLFGGPFELFQVTDTVSLAPEEFESFIELYIAYFNRAPDSGGLYFW
ncbi:hypothetical protein DQW77_16860, partial [Roseovarius sp. TE539]|uniref:hypothetical protein n=1 Tax=Roseovarius sp. TE539 TaxID=2249812 RepID=UPI000DFC232B